MWRCLDSLPHCPASWEDLQEAVEIMQKDFISPEHWADFLLRLPSHEPGIRINGGVCLVLTG